MERQSRRRRTPPGAWRPPCRSWCPAGRAIIAPFNTLTRDTTQVDNDVAHRLVAITPASFRSRLVDDHADLRRHVHGQWLDRSAHDRVHDVEIRRADERAASRQPLHVGSGRTKKCRCARRRLPGCLLRRHVTTVPRITPGPRPVLDDRSRGIAGAGFHEPSPARSRRAWRSRSSVRMFSGLMSRCRMPAPCAVARRVGDAGQQLDHVAPFASRGPHPVA